MTTRVFSYIALDLGYVLCFSFPWDAVIRSNGVIIYTYISCTHGRSVLLNALSKMTFKFTPDHHLVRYYLKYRQESFFAFIHSTYTYRSISARKYKKLEALRQCHLYRYRMFITTTACQSHCFYIK